MSNTGLQWKSYISLLFIKAFLEVGEQSSSVFRKIETMCFFRCSFSSRWNLRIWVGREEIRTFSLEQETSNFNASSIRATDHSRWSE